MKPIFEFSPTHSTVTERSSFYLKNKTKASPIYYYYTYILRVFYFVCVSISRFFALSLSKYYRILKCHFSRFVTQLTFIILPLPPPSFYRL